MIEAVALSELLIDFATVGTDTDDYPTMVAHPGGASANFLTALTKFGTKTALIGNVAPDTFGKFLLGTLNIAGIDTQGMVVTDDVFTTLAFVIFDAHGDRNFAFSRKLGVDTCLDFEEIDLPSHRRG